MCATLSEKVNDLRQREQVSRNKIQHLEERLVCRAYSCFECC